MIYVRAGRGKRAWTATADPAAGVTCLRKPAVRIYAALGFTLLDTDQQ
jgi:hypothetical protein